MIHYQNLTPVTSTSLCPDYGCNLGQFDDFTYGNITIDRREELHFEGRELRFPKSQHLILEGLVQARGRGLTRSFLATVLGGDIFDQIVSMRGFGAYRWAYRELPETVKLR